MDVSDSDFEGIPIRCWHGGSGPAVLLLHGSGPGASTPSNFKRLIPLLRDEYRVLATDLVGYGRSGRRAERPFFDVAMWTRQVHRVIDWAGADEIILIGHSLSGMLALRVAARDARVTGIVTTGTMGVVQQRPDGPSWRFPQTREQLRAQVERTVFRPELVDEQELVAREEILHAPGYQEYFEAMFGLEQQHYLAQTALADDELEAIGVPVILMHGREDRSFAPEETSLRLARSIRRADVHVLAECAHSVALEHPEKVRAAVGQLSSTRLVR